LIWDIGGSVTNRVGIIPIKQIKKSAPVANISWSIINPDWVAIASGNTIDVAHV
jgi:hypothetical protein